ncbi:MAG: hypothetical protein ACREPT_06705 [Rudaea sp.]
MRLPRRHASVCSQRGRALPWILVALALTVTGWCYLAPQTLPQSLRAYMPRRAKAAPTNVKVKVYKSRDDKGRIQFTSSPPPDRPFQTLSYDRRLNVMPSVIPPPPPAPTKP